MRVNAQVHNSGSSYTHAEARIYGMTRSMMNKLSTLGMLLHTHVLGIRYVGILSYVGRKSGRLYRTPLNVFKRDDRYVVALTYGSEVDWVRNVLAAGQADLRARGRDIHLVEPELFVDPTRHLMPLPVRIVLRLNDVEEFLRMKVRSDRA